MPPASKSNEYREYWPYEDEQVVKSYLLVDRIVSYRPLIEMLIDYFHSYQRTYRSLHKNTKQFAQHLAEISGKDVLFEKEFVVVPLTKMAEEMAVKHSDLERAIQLQIIDPLTETLKDTHRHVKGFERSLDHHFKLIKKQRRETYKLITENLTSLDNDTDPWLTEKVLNQHIQSISSVENGNRKKVALIHQDIRQFDMAIVEALLEMLHKFALLQKLYHSEIQTSINGARQFAQQIGSGISFDEYSSKLHLVDAGCFNPNVTKEDYPIPFDRLKPNQIVRSGILERPGIVRKSKFRPSWFVLTENGHLHCFKSRLPGISPDDVRDSSELIYSVNLKSPKVNITCHDEAECSSIEITVPHSNNGLLLPSATIYMIRCASKGEVDEWSSDMSEFLLKNRDMPQIEE